MFLNRSASKERVGNGFQQLLKDRLHFSDVRAGWRFHGGCRLFRERLSFSLRGHWLRFLRDWAAFSIGDFCDFRENNVWRWFVRPCCLLLLLYGRMVWAKDVCSLKIQAALYFGDQLVAVERLNFGNFLRSFTPITSAPLCYTSLLDAASVASRCPHFQHTLACRLDPELAGE
jgi:hypothetical protein